MANYDFSNYVCAKYASFLLKKPVSVTHLEKFSHVLMSFSEQVRHELLNPPQNKKSDEAEKVLNFHFHVQTIKNQDTSLVALLGWRSNYCLEITNTLVIKLQHS